MPAYVENNNIYLSDSTYQLAKVGGILNPYSDVFYWIDIPLKTKVTVDLFIIKQHYSLAFELIYFDKILKKEKSICGVWSGYYNVDYQKEIFYSKLE